MLLDATFDCMLQRYLTYYPPDIELYIYTTYDTAVGNKRLPQGQVSYRETLTPLPPQR